MSWQAYVDSSLVGSGHIDKAAIVSIAGDSAWATTAGFTLSAGEMKALADIYANPANQQKAQAEGIYIAGDRYVVAQIDDRSIYARKGRLGVCICKTKQAILVGHHGEAMVAGNSRQTVEVLADYLIGVGY
ncbi:profilin [Microdochium trichocladiopsis]|uniref:Profilin n=1 Tax=Microdochium trichocladiopsis TaxID=1682393 RepID=A0A9P9BWZ4_9PEZI|nr:profilin [Microdochium trichocladiopsis]KAH7035581.1 profilin [Microdochium trichocladiopsis]